MKKKQNPLNAESRKKLRSKIIRKGLFTQLDYTAKKLEPENRLFRTVIDHALYDITTSSQKVTAIEEKKDALNWLNLNNKDFNYVCLLAGLDPVRTYHMCLYFLKVFFTPTLNEVYCHQKQSGGIVKFSSDKLGACADEEFLKFSNQT